MGIEYRRSNGRGGSFSRVAPAGLTITKPGASTVELSGRWTPGDPIRPAILWGYRPAVHLRRWLIKKAEKGGWSLEATADGVEEFLARQQPLVFAAPRQKGGFLHWPVIGHIERVGPSIIRANLGQPEF